jgi:hypothetical protein
MRLLPLLLLCACLVATGCRKRKSALEQAAAAVEAAQPKTSPATAAAAPPPVTADQLEAGPEFADLNNLVSWFYDRNKRVPTMQELAKMYAGPMPNPPGYKLVIDPKTKTVKAVR